MAGACGVVGSGIALSFLQEGATVWLPMRNEHRFNDFKALVPEDLHEQLRFFKCDLADELQVIELKNEVLKTDGQLNHAVSSIGGWSNDGLLSAVKLEEFIAKLNDRLIPQFLVYQVFSKVLSETPGSTFTSIQGLSPESESFAPEASLIPVAAGALYGLLVSAKSEFIHNPNIKFKEFRLSVRVHKQADEAFGNANHEVGHDYIGKFLPKMCLKHTNEIFRLRSREEGDKLFSAL